MNLSESDLFPKECRRIALSEKKEQDASKFPEKL